MGFLTKIESGDVHAMYTWDGDLVDNNEFL